MMSERHRTNSHIGSCAGADIWAWIVVGLIGIHTVVFGSMQLLAGDDAVYADGMKVVGNSLCGYIKLAGGHWIYSNGRMANLLAPWWLGGVNRWVLDVVNGLMCCGFYALTLVLSGLGKRHTATAKLFVTALLLLTFPWWDAFMLYDVMFNYVWSSALVMAVLWLLLRGATPRWRWGAWLLAAFAASMHEGLGVSVSVGLCAWMWMSKPWRELSSVQRGMVISFFCGTLFALLSPGIWGRFIAEGFGVGERIPNDVLWLLLLKSDFYALSLVIFVAFMAVFRRHRLVEMSHTPWIIFVVASIVAACMSGSSGIVGRSGWFAQLTAIIALVQWGRRYGWHIGRVAGGIVSAVLSVLILGHLIAVDVVQSRMRRELAEALQTYSRNPYEPVYMDYLPWDAYRWLTLAKVRGIPEPYEKYMSMHYSTQYAPEGMPPMVVLPAALRDMAVKDGDMTRVGDGFVTSTLPDLPYAGAPAFEIGGKHYIPVRYTDAKKRQMYYLAPLNLRCGDRIYYQPAIEL